MLGCDQLHASVSGYLFNSSSELRDGFDLEVQSDQREHEALEVLDQVVEYSEALRVLALLDIEQRTDLGGLFHAARGVQECSDHIDISQLIDTYCERNVLLIHFDLQLLSAYLVWLRPVVVVFSGDLAVRYDAFKLLDHQRTELHCVYYQQDNDKFIVSCMMSEISIVLGRHPPSFRIMVSFL